MGNECFEAISGTVRFTYSGYWSPGCTAEGEVTRDVGEGDAYLDLFPSTYAGNGFTAGEVPVSISCDGQPVCDGNVPQISWFTIQAYPLVGEYTFDDATSTQHQERHLVRPY